MKDFYKNISMFRTVLRQKLSQPPLTYCKYNVLFIAGAVGFASVAIKEYLLNILSRCTLKVITEVCANPTPGSVYPMFQAFDNCKVYSQPAPATYSNAILYFNKNT
jgi:hypothetical protein